MNQNVQAKVDNYTERFEQIKGKVNDEIVARTILTEVSKDRRMEQIREERGMRNDDAATTRQLKLMKKLGMDIPEGITKKEASALLDEEFEAPEFEQDLLLNRIDDEQFSKILEALKLQLSPFWNCLKQ